MTSPSITFFANHLAGGGGAERGMILLASELDRRGFKVDFVVAQGGGEDQTLLSDRVRFIDLEARRLARSVGLFVQYLNSSRPRVVLSALAATNLVAITAVRISRLQTRVVVAEHSCPLYQHQRSPFWQVRLAHRLSRWVYSLADEVVAVSEGVASELRQFCYTKDTKPVVIPNAVLPRDFLRGTMETVEHRWLKETEEVPVIVAAGRLVPVKDYPTLIRAVARLGRRRRVRLIILGDGPCRDELLRLSRSLGIDHHVHLVGHVTNPFAWLARADVVAVSSLAESFGNVIVEAMACSRPVVSTDCPVGPREILRGGRYGFLVPVGDDGAFSEALEEALEGPKDLEAGYQRALQFTAERVADRYLRVLLPQGSESSPLSRSVRSSSNTPP